MDKLVLAQKLESLRRCVQRVEEKRPTSPLLLTDDADLQDVIVLNLARAVQLSVDIGSHIISQSNEPSPATMAEVFSALERLDVIDQPTRDNLRKVVGFRNIAIHNYEAIDWQIVFNICWQQLVHFQQLARSVTRFAGL